MSIKTLRKELKKWTSKKSDTIKEKNVEEQTETQKQPTHDENNSLQTDTQPEEQDKQLLDQKAAELFQTVDKKHHSSKMSLGGVFQCTGRRI